MKINKVLFVGVAALSLFTFSSCIDEVEPQSSTATEEQVNASSTAMSALVWGLPSYFNASATDYHYEFGYGTMIHMRDVMTGDQPIVSSGYDWFSPWQATTGINQNTSRSWYTWAYYYKFIHNTNQVLTAVRNANPSGDMVNTYNGYAAVARAFRALAYLELAQMYEFKANDKTTSVNADGNDVSGLTVPIVTDTTTQEQAQNNPRATVARMSAFILSDLQFALDNIDYFTESSKVFPHKAAVYGLLARYYLWREDYPNAEAAARNAIDNSDVSPMTETDCLSTTSGFNDISKWIWGANQTDANASVSTGIINWTSWMSNETTFGYAGAGPYVMIDASMYDRISNNDFRKKEWKAPEGEALYGQTAWIDESTGESLPDYASAKFRPNMGDVSNYSIGAASSYPVMRVEEMYFIEAEAAAHQNAERGLQLLTNFMKTYRNPTYTTRATSQDDIIDEIIFQKRVELWGEGLTFFDIKRLNMSVTRGYSGSNFASARRFNTDGRPAWMNFVFYRTEAENNTALDGWNNPNPQSLYAVWSGQ